MKNLSLFDEVSAALKILDEQTAVTTLRRRRRPLPLLAMVNKFDVKISLRNQIHNSIFIFTTKNVTQLLAAFLQFYCTCFGRTYTKIGTIQRRLAWPLRPAPVIYRETHFFSEAFLNFFLVGFVHSSFFLLKEHFIFCSLAVR